MHRIPTYGFLFREKETERNIIKESINLYQIPQVRIPAIKKGEDFITSEGLVIKNEDLTLAPRKPLSYAYCSDTLYFKQLASYVRNADLLYHEATFDMSQDKLASVTGHSTSIDAARTALEAEAGTLLIGHFSARYKDITFLVEEAKTIFPNTIAAIEGETIEIGHFDNR
jgi:ribonuclease Z